MDTNRINRSKVQKDTVIVKRDKSRKKYRLDFSNNIPIDEETFNMIFNEALEIMSTKEKMYVTDRVVGADSKYALPVKTVTDQSLMGVFTDNMFRPVPKDIKKVFFMKMDFIFYISHTINSILQNTKEN